MQIFSHDLSLWACVFFSMLWMVSAIVYKKGVNLVLGMSMLQCMFWVAVYFTSPEAALFGALLLWISIQLAMKEKASRED